MALSCFAIGMSSNVEAFIKWMDDKHVCILHKKRKIDINKTKTQNSKK